MIIQVQQGRITSIIDVREGEKNGRKWKMVNTLVEIPNENQKLAVSFFENETKIEIGLCADMEIEIKTNEWQGKYFTQLSAKKIENIYQNKPTPQAQAQEQPAPTAPPDDDDLPF